MYIVPVSKNHLGKRVKAFRLDRQMTQVQVAQFLGVSRGTIRNLEAGQPYREITAAKIEKLIKREVAA